MYLVLEYMKMGDLVNILKSRSNGEENAINSNLDSSHGNRTVAANKAEGFTPLNDLEVWNIFKQVNRGVKFLHMNNVIHGDIKPQVINKSLY